MVLFWSSDLIFPPAASASGGDMISNVEEGLPYKWHTDTATQKWKCHISNCKLSLTLSTAVCHCVWLCTVQWALYQCVQWKIGLYLSTTSSRSCQEPHHPYEPSILWKQTTAGNKSLSNAEMCPQVNPVLYLYCRPCATNLTTLFTSDTEKVKYIAG